MLLTVVSCFLISYFLPATRRWDCRHQCHLQIRHVAEIPCRNAKLNHFLLRGYPKLVLTGNVCSFGHYHVFWQAAFPFNADLGSLKDGVARVQKKCQASFDGSPSPTSIALLKLCVKMQNWVWELVLSIEIPIRGLLSLANTFSGTLSCSFISWFSPHYKSGNPWGFYTWILDKQGMKEARGSPSHKPYLKIDQSTLLSC